MDESNVNISILKTLKNCIIDQWHEFRKKIISAIKIFFSKEGKITRKYLSRTLFFLFFPYIIKLFILLGQEISDDERFVKINWYDDFKNGSIIVYGISLLAPIWYTLELAIKKQKKNKEDIPASATLIAIVIGLILYIVYFLFDLIAINLKSWLVIFTSILFLLVSYYLAFKAHIFEISDIQNPDEHRKIEEKRIEERLKSNNMDKKTISKGIKGKANDLEDALKDFDDEEDEDNE
jgi:hypothetical protein